MIQHPIPTNVTAYQFRLIGDMTIKQFILLSVGVGGAIFFYYTNLFSPIKWLFVVSSATLGFAVAFMPYEDRPLDQWIVNYIRAIYRPTRYVWRKNHKTPTYLTFKPSGRVTPTDSQELAKSAAIRKQQGFRSYLMTLPQDQNNIMDEKELSSLNQVLGLFNTNNKNNISPDLTKPSASLNIAPEMNIPTKNETASDAPAAAMSKKPNNNGLTGVIAQAPVRVNKIETQISKQNALKPQDGAQPSSSILTENKAAVAIPATIAQDLPFPSTPSTPNTVVGMVLDSSGKIIENAIIEVADGIGQTVRATKTNQLGQFFSTTPLKTGSYQISIEKAGLNFDTIEINLNGEIIEPIKIQAK